MSLMLILQMSHPRSVARLEKNFASLFLRLMNCCRIGNVIAVRYLCSSYQVVFAPGMWKFQLLCKSQLPITRWVFFVQFDVETSSCRLVHLVDSEVEWNTFCQRILRSRMQDGCLKQAPVYSDVRKYVPQGLEAGAEVLTAGFPCQAGA